MRGITWKSFYAPPIRVGAIILILQIGLVISFNFTESSGNYTSSEPKMDLECLNDYITEMMCSLTSDQQLLCPEYSLNVTVFNARFTCDLQQLKSSSCECTVHVNSGFVLGEEYKVNVLRNKSPLFTTNFGTTETIKPKKPVIRTVKETKNGNFLIAWDTAYNDSDDLIAELTYYIEGSKGTRKKVIITTKGQHELVGRNLESNSNYIVMARIQSHLNYRFSDYSDPYRFSTQPKMDLECLNDYITEMMCSLTSDQQLLCPEYSLNVTVFNARFTCDLQQLKSSSCECTVHVNSGFVLGEEYTVNVLRNKSLLFTTNFGTTENIKPKKPVIRTVKETKNGNFLIAWDTAYNDSDDLIAELTYYIEGSKGTRKNVIVPTKGQFKYELVGRNLESNSNYIVMARIQSLLNDRCSDYSDPYRFSTPSSLKNYVKLIIPLIL
ncbi:uncharacterized protein LOC113660392 [Tachysurus fulvidraco]|uniref:uncharacterized protein LOC113660392 n=1 Tax=Tachysurus fulvidraco TaxID=1234273 RepID=UPI001FEDAFD9|nr:uncharacterized protein LOC113660392 [Tachysurus fulvidraco]